MSLEDPYDPEPEPLDFLNRVKMEELGEFLGADVARSCATKSCRNEATQEIIIAGKEWVSMRGNSGSLAELDKGKKKGSPVPFST